MRSLTYYHGWFTFPKTEYTRLFESLNGVPYASIAAAQGNLVDNHHAGLDRIYLWREAGSPDRPERPRPQHPAADGGRFLCSPAL